MTYPPKHRIVLLAIFILIIVLGIITIVTPAAIFPDASWGFQVMRCMQMGGAFNILTKPSQQNLAQTTSDFISWWSPGQYLVPYFFKLVFGLNTGQAASVTTLLCQLLGLSGFYVFFKKVGFTPLISALSLAIIICQQAFFTPFIFYIGGETLLFAFSGWFLYGCITFNKPGWQLVLFILLAGWIGFICKSSFIWIYGAGLLFMWVQLSTGQTSAKKWFFKGFWVGIPAVLSVLVIYGLYLSKGLNPSSASAGFGISLKSLAFPVASPILAGFSADDLVNGLIFHNDDAILSTGWVMPVLIFLAILSIILIYAICTRVPHKKYTTILILFYGVSLIFFGSAFMRKLDISYEARHFRIIGLLIIPGTLHLFSQYKIAYRVLFGLGMIVIAFFTGRFYAAGYYGLRHYTAYGISGVGQQFIDQASLNYVKMLDNSNKNATFVFFSPDLGLEVQHNRVITLDEPNKDIDVYKGHAGTLYIIMPSYYEGLRANIALKSFPGYKGFSLKKLSDYYMLYLATEAR